MNGFGKSKDNSNQTRIRMKRFLIVALFSVGAMIVMLTIDPNLQPQTNTHLIPDDSILTYLPCHIPCWHSLVAGLSTIDDVNRLISTDPFIAPYHLKKNISEVGISFQWWQYSDLESSVIRVSKNDVVSSIEIDPYLSFSLKNIIDLYGSPSASEVMVAIINGKANINLSLDYPSDGMIVEFYCSGCTTNNSGYELSPEMKGSGFRLYKPTTSLSGFIWETNGYIGKDLENYFKRYIILGWFGMNSILVPPQSVDEPIKIIRPTPSPMTKTD